MQSVDIKRRVKCPVLQSIYSQLHEKEADDRSVLSLVLNDRRHFDDVISDGKFFQVLCCIFIYF